MAPQRVDGFLLDPEVVLISIEMYVRYAPEGVRKSKSYFDTVSRLVDQTREIERVLHEQKIKEADRIVESVRAISVGGISPAGGYGVEYGEANGEGARTGEGTGEGEGNDRGHADKN